MHGWKRWLIVGGVATLIVVVGGPFVYFHFIQGPAAPPLAISDTVPTTDASARRRPRRSRASTARGRSAAAPRWATA